MAENVNEQIQVPEEQVRKAEHFWEDPQNIMRLLDSPVPLRRFGPEADMLINVKSDKATFLSLCPFSRLELRMHYDGNCGAFIFLLIVSNLQRDARIRDFLMLIFRTTM